MTNTNMARTTKKTLDFYLDLTYPIKVEPAEEGGFVVSIPDLPGCITQVEKWEEAFNAIDEVRKEWITVAFEDHAEIPLPKPEREYSGKFVIRVPKSIHRRLDERAEDEGVSLNTLAVSLISQGLGAPKPHGLPGKKFESPTVYDLIEKDAASAKR